MSATKGWSETIHLPGCHQRIIQQEERGCRWGGKTGLQQGQMFPSRSLSVMEQQRCETAVTSPARSKMKGRYGTVVPVAWTTKLTSPVENPNKVVLLWLTAQAYKLFWCWPVAKQVQVGHCGNTRRRKNSSTSSSEELGSNPSVTTGSLGGHRQTQ